jgi:hypothetical protein
MRYFFPLTYLIFLTPAAAGLPLELKIIDFVSCFCFAIAVGRRTVFRLASLLVVALFTLLPFLAFVQTAFCSSIDLHSSTMVSCIVTRSGAVLLNVGLLSSVFLMAVANEWRGSLVATVNGMCLPRRLSIMVIISGSMIGEFRRAMIRVHHAFTARGKALPSVSWRNLVVLPVMLGAVWASVLDGAVERINGQWSSDRFWTTYVAPSRPFNIRSFLSDFAVLGAGALVAWYILIELRLL